MLRLSSPPNHLPLCQGSTLILGTYSRKMRWLLDDFSEPQLLLDGRQVLTGSARKPRKEITDILSWVEAFTVCRTFRTDGVICHRTSF